MMAIANTHVFDDIIRCKNVRLGIVLQSAAFTLLVHVSERQYNMYYVG